MPRHRLNETCHDRLMVSTSPIKVLTDDDVKDLAVMSQLVAVCATAVDDDAKGRLFAPPRLAAELGEGRLVFTAGGNSDVVGFRAYETFPASQQDQLVAVWHPQTGKLAGVVVGELLGALRTGALGGVAVDRLAPSDASRCAVIGTGLQARTQLMACAEVRQLTEVRVYSRNDARRRAFAAEMADLLGISARPADSAAEAIDGAEIALIATSSGQPVVSAEALAEVAHVTTVGPKFVGHHEMPLEAVEGADVVASDSPQQIHAHGKSHFLHGSSVWPRIEHLGKLGSGKGRSVFLSAGLAGTEVLVANDLLARR